VIQFTLVDGRIVTVNPTFIRSVEPYGNETQTLIRFAKDDYIVVGGSYQAVVNRVEAALKSQ
jgi:uncharacterized protein YlzI (FlbEa/FlbD family)